ncbi:hypothetical protein SDC9_150754 [bioreactor metagenome]|uniref:Uncharacterized protein n=1 Tax=bioreactor metagenome TaxID=1076179 RepID=A0A645ESN9_9ZZZZ
MQQERIELRLQICLLLFRLADDLLRRFDLRLSGEFVGGCFIVVRLLRRTLRDQIRQPAGTRNHRAAVQRSQRRLAVGRVHIEQVVREVVDCSVRRRVAGNILHIGNLAAAVELIKHGAHMRGIDPNRARVGVRAVLEERFLVNILKDVFRRRMRGDISVRIGGVG